MSFGSNLVLTKRALAIVATLVLVLSGLMLAWQLNAASNCTGPTYDAGTKTLSLVCTESSDTHELSCSDATNPDTLSLTVNGRTETLTCPPDVPPNALPGVAIAGPNSGDWGVSYTFTITGTDADVGDILVYHVDWNNDGTPDYVSSSVSSGTGVGVANSWSATGAQTFQARALDSKGGMSPWAQHTITIGNPPAALATLTVSVNNGPFNNVDTVTVNPGDRVDLGYQGQYATSCSGSGTNFSTGGGTSGADEVSPTAVGTDTSFSLSCNGPGGTGPSDNLVVTTRQRPNLTVSQNASPNFGTFSGGVYSNVTIYFNTMNRGGSDTATQADYRVELDLNSDGDYNDANETVNQTDGLGLIAVGGSGENDSVTITAPITIGSHNLRISVDTGNDVLETNEGDNYIDGTVVVPPQDPGLNITANPLRVQNGQNTTISWTMSNPYDGLSCTVSGPGMASVPFTLPGSHTGSRSAGPITSKSEYTMSCVIAGSTFTDSVTVEAQGVIEEI